jgi:hypothetical protein
VRTYDFILVEAFQWGEYLTQINLENPGNVNFGVKIFQNFLFLFWPRGILRERVICIWRKTN